MDEHHKSRYYEMPKASVSLLKISGLKQNTIWQFKDQQQNLF